MLRDLEVVRLDKRIEGLNFLRGLLGPNSVGLMKGRQARERRQLLHSVREDCLMGLDSCRGVG